MKSLMHSVLPSKKGPDTLYVFLNRMPKVLEDEIIQTRIVTKYHKSEYNSTLNTQIPKWFGWTESKRENGMVDVDKIRNGKRESGTEKYGGNPHNNSKWRMVTGSCSENVLFEIVLKGNQFRQMKFF